jgi:hypothetical protein
VVAQARRTPLKRGREVSAYNAYNFDNFPAAADAEQESVP